ncbi:MAG: hypothetical protein U7123_07405 [Potamolinea sp.]
MGNAIIDLPITDYRLPITHYRLPITDYQMPKAYRKSDRPDLI